MQCPNDATTLVMSERSGIEIDYCPQCRGIWLDRGELDKLIERSYEQPPAYSQQGPGHGQPAYGQGSSDTVGRIADKVLRTVQQRASGHGGHSGQPSAGQPNSGQRGGRSWLGDILR